MSDGYALALDAAGRATVTGRYLLQRLPHHPRRLRHQLQRRLLGDAFVVRLNAAGSALDYATFLGGSS